MTPVRQNLRSMVSPDHTRAPNNKAHRKHPSKRSEHSARNQSARRHNAPTTTPATTLNSNQNTVRRSQLLRRTVSKEPVSRLIRKSAKKSTTTTVKMNRRKRKVHPNSTPSSTKRRRRPPEDPEWCPSIQRRLVKAARSSQSHNYYMRKRPPSFGPLPTTYSSTTRSETPYASEGVLGCASSPTVASLGNERTRRILNFSDTPQVRRSIPRREANPPEGAPNTANPCLCGGNLVYAPPYEAEEPEEIPRRTDSVISMDEYLQHNQFVDVMGVDSLGDELIFSCPVCKYGFPNGPLLYAHVKLRHDSMHKAVCCVCGLSFVSRAEMKAHLVAHNRCRFCLGGPFCNLSLHQVLCGWRPSK